jgi:hypothetical protein
VGQAQVGGGTVGRVPGAGGRLAPPGGPKTAEFQRFRKIGGRLACAHCARRPPISRNRGFESVLGLVPRLLGLWGSMGLGGVLLVHLCRHRAQKKITNRVAALRPPPRTELVLGGGGIYTRQRAPRMCCLSSQKKEGVDPHPVLSERGGAPCTWFKV